MPAPKRQVLIFVNGGICTRTGYLHPDGVDDDAERHGDLPRICVARLIIGPPEVREVDPDARWFSPWQRPPGVAAVSVSGDRSDVTQLDTSSSIGAIPRGFAVVLPLGSRGQRPETSHLAHASQDQMHGTAAHRGNRAD